MKLISAIQMLLLGIGYLAIPISGATDAASVDPTVFNGAAESDTPARLTSRSSEPEWSREQFTTTTSMSVLRATARMLE